MALSPEIEAFASEIVDSAYRVHIQLGPGLLERIYEVCLCHELRKRGLRVERQVALPIHYDGLVFDEGLRLDILVEDTIIIELKAVDRVNQVWEAQLLSHLRLANKQLGFLINFNVPRIRDGIQRMAI